MIDPKIRNRLSLPDPTPDTCSWMWILPVPDGRIRIARIVVPRRLVDSGDHFSEADYETADLVFVAGVDEVADALQLLGGDVSGLDVPWRIDFPL